jgi:NTP pyrophosphatase (non-canonical NTP hydrolase)
MVAHDLVNKLSAIVGHCHLLREMTEPGTELAKRLTMIGDLAKSAAKDLTEHQRELREAMRKPDKHRRLAG